MLEARAAALGIAMDEPRVIAILGPGRSPGAGASPEEVRRRLTARLLGAEVWVGRSREGFVALLPEGAEPKALAATAEDLLGEGGRAGVGAPRATSRACGARRAKRSARCGSVRACAAASASTTYAEVAVLDLIGADSAGAERFMRDVLGPLVAAGASPSYLETLRQLAAHNYSVKLAAAALSVHPHTLSYRARQIRRRFGLDLDDAETRLRVQLALWILDARGGAV